MLGASQDSDRGRCMGHDLPQALPLQISLPADLGDVTEHYNSADNLLEIVSNWSRAAADEDMCAISAKKQCVTGKPRSATSLQNLSHWIWYRPPSVRGDEWNGHFDQLAQCLSQTPASGLFSDIIQERNLSVFISADDSICNTFQSRCERTPLSIQLTLKFANDTDKRGDQKPE